MEGEDKGEVVHNLLARKGLNLCSHWRGLFMPTGYSARHVRWEMDRHCLLHLLLLLLLLFLLLALREAALVFQLKVVIGCEALQKSADCVALGLSGKHQHISKRFVASCLVQTSLFTVSL